MRQITGLHGNREVILDQRLKIQQKLKPILLIILLVMLAIVIIIPTKSYAAYIEWPGVLVYGGNSEGCFCPITPYSCGCRVHFDQ